MAGDRVVVAVHGPDVYGVFDGPDFDSEGPDIPYAERTKVALDVTDSTRLGEIIDLAAKELGVTYAHGPVSEAITGVVFYEPEDEMSFKYREEPWPRVIRLADSEGKPSWSVLWTEVRFDELLHAHEAGLVAGDPRRPYFWPVIPQGEGLQTFFGALWTLWLTWEHVLAAYGTFDLVRRLQERVRRGRDAVQDYSIPWERRLARPHDLLAFLAREPRSSSDVAGLLGCRVDQAEGILWALGFTHQDDGRWARTDEAGDLLWMSIMEIEDLGHAPSEDQLRRTLPPE